MPTDGGVDFETFSEIVSLYGDGKGDDKAMIQVVVWPQCINKYSIAQTPSLLLFITLRVLFMLTRFALLLWFCGVIRNIIGG